jgi:hypothetical protein
VGASELGGDADPGGADHAKDLGEDEVAESEFFAEGFLLAGGGSQ